MDSAKSRAFAKPTATIDPERWVEEHGDCLYRYALLRVRRPEIAEDLVQEAYSEDTLSPTTKERMKEALREARHE